MSGQVHTNQTIEHYKLTLSLRDNFSVRLQRSSLGNSKLKYCLHSSTIDKLLVHKSFIKSLYTQKSNDCMSALFR